ncbi:MAG: antibiotic ABC transporter ATP-binding protein, partial [Caldiserica bacterium CG_4_8_14_3_um_filter_35_18]
MKNRYIKRFLPYIFKYKSAIIFALVFLVVASLLSSLIPFIVKNAIDNYISAKNLQGLIKLSIFLLLMIGVQFISKLIQIYLTNLSGQKIMKDLRHDLFQTMESFEIDVFTKEPSGKIITRITNDVENMNELLTSGIVSLLGDMLMVVFSIIFLFYINLKLSLISLIPLPVAIIAALFLGNRMEKIYEKVRDILTRMNIHMQESLTGLPIIQTFGVEKTNLSKFSNITKDFRFTFHKAQMLNIMLRQSINALSYTSIVFVIVFGGLFALKGTATVGTIVAFLVYLNQLYGPLGDLSDRFSILQNAISSMAKLDDFLTSNNVEKEGNKGFKKPVQGEIELENVSFSYDKDSIILENINMKIKKGEKVAIVGFTGAGKSTIANLILSFYEPDSGSVKIDGIDTKILNKKELRKNSAIVLQNIFIFKGSVRDNIALGREDFTEEKIINAAKEIGVHDFIMKLPNGYDTELSTEGKNISVGERQLVSFARALVYNPKILILDEATASIDTNTEEIIENGIKKLMKDRTSIVIAHRLSTIRNADMIYVINKGKIVESGT